MPGDMPSLPLEMPEASPPAPTPSRRERPKRAIARSGGEPDGSVIMIDAARLTIDDRFGLEVDALSARYTKEVAEARSRFEGGKPQAAYPLVVHGDDDRYVAFTALPIVMAAREMIRASNMPLMIGVVPCDAADGDLLLREMFTKAQNRSLFEQARYIAGSEKKYGGRRAWMRAERIDAKKWEPRFSKIANVGRLDGSLLAMIDPHTVTNAEVAGRIVAAWRDPAKRRIITDIAKAAVASSKELLKAGPLLKRIDAALRPTEPAFTTGAWTDGACDLLAADGRQICKVKRDGNDWSITGAELAALTPAILTAALSALKG